MSILGKQHKDPVSPETRAATNVKRITSTAAETIVQNWEQGFDLLWNHRQNIAPEDILQELGEDAAEVFNLSEATLEFIGNIAALDPTNEWLQEKWANVQAKINAKPETEVHPDGTVTIV